MPYLTVDGVRICYDTCGSGVPVVWLPGTGMGLQIWHREQFPTFVRTHQCIGVDLRGSGKSDAPEGDYSIGRMAAETAEVIDLLAPDGAHLVGHSLGSAVVQEIALARPELVRSAVLVSTWGSMAECHHARRWIEARLLAFETAPLDVFRSMQFWMWAPSTVDHRPELMADLESFFLSNTLSQPRHAYQGHFQADLDHEILDRLGRIGCPTLVIYGAEDLITLPWYNTQVAGLIQGATTVEVPEAGHFVFLEQPDRFNRALQQFFAEVESG